MPRLQKTEIPFPIRYGRKLCFLPYPLSGLPVSSLFFSRTRKIASYLFSAFRAFSSSKTTSFNTLM